MDVSQVMLPGLGDVEIASVGPDEGRVILYFHSPATAGEEVEAASRVAEQMGARLLVLRRPSVAAPAVEGFASAVAVHVEALLDALDIETTAVVGWSGGTPYALASAVRLGDRISTVNLVSPVPGPLTGPDALLDQSDRLREVATSTSTSGWVTGPAMLRDYQALASPWGFDLSAVTQSVTIWAPTDDEIVPVRLLDQMAARLQHVHIVEVPGAHDWLMANWAEVLRRGWQGGAGTSPSVTRRTSGGRPGRSRR